MMRAESFPFASARPAPPAPAAVSRPGSRAWSLSRWAGREYDFRLMSLVAFSACILAIGWAGVLLPRWTPAEMLSGGNMSPDDGPPMVDLAPAQADPGEEVPLPAEPPTPPEEVMETPPEPVPVLVTDAAFVIPAPPEIVKPMTVAEVKPDRPKPQPSPQPLPRRAANPGPPAQGPVAQTGGGQGAGPAPVAKPGRPKTPQPPYPSFARSAKMTGTVVVSLVVDASGGVVSVSVVRSCGFSQLDGHTCDYIRRAWHWPAGERRTFTQNVVYRLR